ncbi:ABC transporter ATP-binding protein [Kyrpidia spormannii]|uniref:ABC transporter ATP-binding protein n=1 Tax=Kyrpidia spormannii TaxID=2055160 RepID=A0A2K8NA02_9BACL|nr:MULTISPECIES: ATP-binding cassette domain-containing protein [Kyrpidia]ATY86171.1 ABC transporter ATP-binding protein [Kyrpidia spormannii]MCL6577322.1 ATP-binding cassette domain-containing protein [Kyrpidia sp.]
MIELRSVTKRFKQVTALHDVSFDVQRGEVVGLIGENGAGKTTTLRLIATVLRPTAGSIRVAGLDTVRHPREVRRKVGLLFGGETGLYDRLTARENIAYFGRLFGLDDGEIHRRTEALAERFAMTEYLDRRVGGFSKGMRQKTVIARSLIHQPEVVLLDEPTSGLDITSAAAIRQLIRDFQKEGRTVIFSSHISGEVERLCDRVLILRRGGLEFAGSIAELYRRTGTEDLDAAFVRAAEGGLGR